MNKIEGVVFFLMMMMTITTATNRNAFSRFSTKTTVLGASHIIRKVLQYET
jgi:hypothetical protein